jgi:predicted PurR-regulated permease PerM
MQDNLLMPSNTARPVDQLKLVRMAAAGIIGALVVAALYFGRPVLVPFALAILLAFPLSPAAEYLRKFGLPRMISVALTVTTAVLFIGGLGTFIGTQVGLLAADLPHYQVNFTKKIESVRGAAASNSIVANATVLFTNFNNTIGENPTPAHGTQPTSMTPAQKIQPAVPIEIGQPELTPFQVIKSVVEPLLEPIAILALAIIFVVFILLQKEDLRDRFISLTGARDLQRTTFAIDDGAQRLSRYLLLQTGVNACVGLFIGFGLWACGIPNPALWGLIAGILRFVPYIGIPAAAAVPLMLALAVDSGWTLVVLVAGLFFLTEAVVGQVIEPWLYGRNVGLSPVAVLLSAAFWTLVWGPLGLLLSTPLTMCLVVLGRHVPQLRFLDTLLGDRPSLSSAERFYLHLLKGSPDELAEHAELFLKEKSLSAYFDEVAVKGLALAQLDIDRGAVTAGTRDNILLTVEGLIENLTEDIVANAPTGDDLPARQMSRFASTAENQREVLCVAGRGSVDQAAASLLKHLLGRHGIETRVITPEEASQANISRIDASGVTAICLSYLEPESPANARFLVRRLRKQIPNAPLIAGFWGLEQSDTHYLDWIEVTGSDFVACNLTSAVQYVFQSLKGFGDQEEVPRAMA